MVALKTYLNVSETYDVSMNWFKYLLLSLMLHLNVQIQDMFRSTKEQRMSQINKLRKH